MTDKIARLTEELKAHLQNANTIAATADDEGRDFTDDERAAVTESMRKAQDVKKSLDAAKADTNVRAAIKDLGDAVGLVDGQAEAKGRREQADRDGYQSRAASIGETFITSEQYKDLLRSAPNGQFAKDMRVQSRPVGYKDLVTGLSPTSGGAFRTEDYRGVLVGPEQFFRPLTLRQLVTGGTTTSDQIEYARITGWNNAAAPVAEATSSAPVGSGEPAVTPAQAGVKPESGFSTVRVTTPVRTIAHWIPVTKRALSDAAQVRTLIDSFLETGLEEELEDQMIAGDGTGENFEGLSTVSGTQTQAAVADPAGKPAGFGKLLAVRRAKTKVRTVGRSVANGVVIHPNDLETLDEISDMQGRFYFGGPSGANGTSPLWGLPVIESEAAKAGTAWVGDFRKAILWDRQQASLTVTDSHADFFVRNLVAILAELRAAFGVIQPSAFCKVSLA
ncbi:phage major capsid protein [Amycolatopsis sp. cg5]|uniref:phage major capsid protein n=1 Tax=Amycolatopsis sp. cg5 TaxID=3238802 RepID=UPI00352595CB